MKRYIRSAKVTKRLFIDWGNDNVREYRYFRELYPYEEDTWVITDDSNPYMYHKTLGTTGELYKIPRGESTWNYYLVTANDNLFAYTPKRNGYAIPVEDVKFWVE